MKTYKMSSEQIKIRRNSKLRTTFTLFVVLFIINILLGVFLYYRVNFIFYLSILLLILAICSSFNTGIHHFELDGNILSHFKRGELKDSFDLKQVRVVATVGENQSTLIIKDDGDTKANYHSEILGITVFNELLKDISVINDGTYQS